MTTVSRCKPCVPRSGEGQEPAPPRAFLGGLEGNLEVCGGRGTKQDNPKILHLPAVRRAPEPPVPARSWERILPTLGWGKQSIWLAASGRQTPFAGRSPHPLSRRGPPPRG